MLAWRRSDLLNAKLPHLPHTPAHPRPVLLLTHFPCTHTGQRLVRACAVETHMEFEKSHFVWKFTGKRPHAPATTSIKHRALTVTARTPSVWPHCLGKKKGEATWRQNLGIERHWVTSWKVQARDEWETQETKIPACAYMPDEGEVVISLPDWNPTAFCCWE